MLLGAGGLYLMRAMVLSRLTVLRERDRPLELAPWPDPTPKPGEIIIRVSACGVCHTELDEIEGRAPPPVLPVIPGHQVVGRVAEIGPNVDGFAVGDRVGVAWIYSACGVCERCRAGEENLCPQFRATGKDAHGGYAEKMAVPAAFAYHLPDSLTDQEVAPLLCAGAIGYRAFHLTGLRETGSLGLMGFGASGHLVLKFVRARWPKIQVLVFSRNPAERELAQSLGAFWTGEITANPPVPLDAIIDTTPVWRPVLAALRCLRPGGRLVINAIRKEDYDKNELLQISYPEHLWLEKEIKSVANVTRQDVRDFLALAAEIGLRPVVREFKLEQANEALLELKFGKAPGAKVLVID